MSLLPSQNCYQPKPIRRMAELIEASPLAQILTTFSFRSLDAAAEAATAILQDTDDEPEAILQGLASPWLGNPHQGPWFN